MTSKRPRYSVYVVQVRSKCVRCKRRRKVGGRCCLYVGETWHPPEVRLEKHLQGKPKTVITECGGKLRPDLYKGMVFRNRDDARSVELSLAAYLKTRGYVVFGGH